MCWHFHSMFYTTWVLTSHTGPLLHMETPPCLSISFSINLEIAANSLSCHSISVCSGRLGWPGLLNFILQILEAPVPSITGHPNLIFLPTELESSATLVGLEQILSINFHECILSFSFQYSIRLSQSFVYKISIFSLCALKYLSETQSLTYVENLIIYLVKPGLILLSDGQIRLKLMPKQLTLTKPHLFYKEVLLSHLWCLSRERSIHWGNSWPFILCSFFSGENDWRPEW